MSDYKANIDDLTKKQLGRIINVQTEVYKQLEARAKQLHKELKEAIQIIRLQVNATSPNDVVNSEKRMEAFLDKHKEN